MGLPLAKPEPSICGGSASVIMYLRSGTKQKPNNKHKTPTKQTKTSKQNTTKTTTPQKIPKQITNMQKYPQMVKAPDREERSENV